MIPRRLGLLALVVCGGWLGWSASAGATTTTPQGTSVILQLTTDPANDLRPAWSPDGNQIAFQSNRDGPYHIYLMNVDGSNQRALTKGPMDDRHPAWMPDGKSILFDSDDDSREEIWMVNLADGGLKQITRLGLQANFPEPSPDGQHIAFYVYKDESLNLWTARVDGSDARPVTQGLATAENSQCTFACHPAAWSPDGQSLAYSDGNQKAIWMMRSDGSDPGEIISSNDENDHFPRFLADGRLGFVTEHIESSRAWTDAWVYDLSGHGRTLLQGAMSVQGPIEWNADNTQVLFHSPRAGNFDIYMINLRAPGGVAVLQGTPVPAVQARGAVTPIASQATHASSSDRVDGNQMIWMVFAGMAGASMVGLVVWIFGHRHSRN